MNSSQVSGQSILSLVECKVEELARTLLVSESYINVFGFGSQATGRALIRSDIDLGHPIDPKVMTAIRDAFDDLSILQRVDIIDFSSVDATFKAVALQKIKSVYERQAA